jgi:glycosyltransferase involved in cell wall biosynthesis
VIAHITVVIPAADEQDEIGGCLESVQVARQQLHRMQRGAVTSAVVVVLDDCQDATASVVAGFSDVVPVPCVARSVGTARRLGTECALATYGARGHWLANTDADCRVPPHWLNTLVDEAARGAQVVLGTVRPAAGLPPAVERAWYSAHQLRDDHPHVHGANLGIAAESYAAAGGWRDLSTHEDVDLVRRVWHARIHRTGATPVVTSVRPAGRAPLGFASYLRDLADAG